MGSERGGGVGGEQMYSGTPGEFSSIFRLFSSVFPVSSGHIVPLATRKHAQNLPL